MKAQHTRKKNYKIFVTSIGALMISVSIFAQNLSIIAAKASNFDYTTIKNEKEFIQVKGIVNDEEGPLGGVSIILKGTTIGTSSNFKGEFTFPRELNEGDVLMFSYLGYKKEEITITNSTSFIELTLIQDDIDILEALPVEKPYKTKRNKSKRRPH